MEQHDPFESVIFTPPLKPIAFGILLNVGPDGEFMLPEMPGFMPERGEPTS